MKTSQNGLLAYWNFDEIIDIKVRGKETDTVPLLLLLCFLMVIAEKELKDMKTELNTK